MEVSCIVCLLIANVSDDHRRIGHHDRFDVEMKQVLCSPSAVCLLLVGMEPWFESKRRCWQKGTVGQVLGVVSCSLGVAPRLLRLELCF